MAIAESSSRKNELFILQELKNRLGFKPADTNTPFNRSGSEGADSGQQFCRTKDNKNVSSGLATSMYDGSFYPTMSTQAVDAFLLRFLKAKNYSISEAIAKLKRRRKYEYALPSLSVPSLVIEALRSGAILPLGVDSRQRPAIYFNAESLRFPILDEADTQRLIIILLEYLQSMCVEQNNLQATKSTSNSCIQQILFILNMHGSSWVTYEANLSKLTIVLPIMMKYYPNLIGTILVLDAALDVKQGIRDVMSANEMESLKDSVVFIERTDLIKYLPVSSIPQELKGTLEKRNSSALEFSETVLRHWYLLTFYIQLELAPSNKNPAHNLNRPLYILPPQLSSIESLSAFQKKSIGISYTDSNNPSHHSLISDINTPLSELGLNAVIIPSQLSPLIDDGICSILSETDEAYESPVHPLNSSNNPTHHSHTLVDLNALISIEEEKNIRAHPDKAIQCIQQEREKRIIAEKRLQLVEIGVALDPSHASELEKGIAALHEEVNVLIAGVVVHAREAEKHGQEPNLVQLLDLTITALESASGQTVKVPAMAFAQPLQREDRKWLCCNMM